VIVGDEADEGKREAGHQKPLWTGLCPSIPFSSRQPADKMGGNVPTPDKEVWMSLEGTVVNGVIVFDEEERLPEGTRVEINVKEVPKATSPLGEMLLRHAGKAVGLPEDMAEQHDHYLHGTPKR